MSEGEKIGTRKNKGEIQAYKGETGDISITYNELGTEVNWRISHFWSLLEEDGIYYKSPNFSFDRHRWWLVIYPNGDGGSTSVGHIDLRLVRYSDNLPDSYDVLMSLESTNGSKVNERCNTKVFEKDSRYQHFDHFISRFELRKRLTELLPHSILTVSCTLKKETPPKGSRMCSYCKKRFDPESISSHQKKCTQKPIKCPDCLEVIHLQKWLDDHECQMERAAALEKLSNDLKEMMLNEDHSDVLVIVKGEKFRLHKNILAARNPFFCAMFNNDMREKNTGIVRINDCAPDVFRYFIHFLYTGNADGVSSENVFELHEIANKYHEDQLKKGCLHFMMSMMSVDNFCDLVAFALRYDYKNLLQNATEFFLENAKEIVNSEKWIIFQEEYPRQADEYNLAFNNFDVK